MKRINMVALGKLEKSNSNLKERFNTSEYLEAQLKQNELKAMLTFIHMLPFLI